MVKLDLGAGGRAALVLCLFAGPAAAAGPAGADACTACHVKGGGVGQVQGRPAEDSVRLLEGYRSGGIPSTLMGRLVKGFTQDEVKQLAAWFSKQ